MTPTPARDVPGLTLRPGTPADAEVCGRICYEAFRTIAERHGFPPDLPSPAFAGVTLGHLLAHPGVHSVVAERGGRIVGSNFLDERSTIAGVGPITVDPEGQNAGVRRRLMLAVLARAAEKRFPGVRLLQSAYHNRSLSLYTALGFNVREPVVILQGFPVQVSVPGYTVRRAGEGDLAACNRICMRVHGHDRAGEVRDAIGEGTARVVERGGRITGYTRGIAFFGHSIGETDEDLQILIGAAEEFGGPGFLVPARSSRPGKAGSLLEMPRLRESAFNRLAKRLRDRAARPTFRAGYTRGRDGPDSSVPGSRGECPIGARADDRGRASRPLPRGAA